MSQGRPEILFPLFADLPALPGVGPKTAKALEKLGIARPRDLCFTLPSHFTDRTPRASIQGATLPGVVTVEVTIGGHMPARQRGRPYRIWVEDDAAEFQLVFFHAREEWLTRQLPPGERRVVSGKVEVFEGLAQMVHPDHILLPEEAGTLPRYEPVYPIGAGITQRAMQKAVTGALERAPDLPDWLDRGLRAKHHWPDWREALHLVHAPVPGDAGRMAAARERLAYDELLAHQLTLALARARMKRAKGRRTAGDGALRAKLLAALPYAPTGAQARAVEEIAGDMAGALRMNRLLQGDVGAGKTLVAMLAMAIAAEAGGQAALMAPTEILARQHLEGIGPLAEAAGLRVGLFTGRDKGAERAEKRARLAAGEIDIAIGTHALFQRDIAFADLRLAVVDEQHRFGVRQRMELGAKGQAPDVLVMTATPIPRSLALSTYGDMDLSVLDEKPPGRQPIDTVLVSSGRLSEVVERLRGALAEGRRAYWVCPLVEESETVAMTAAEDRAQALRAALGEGLVGLVHGQMPPAQKDAAMADFIAGRTRLLVATTVIEVGVNVPEATIMVIEGAQSFGLAQLHQLRGRVGRGAGKSTCLMLYDPPLGETAQARLSILRETEDGFRIAEEDLRLRGAGDLIGHQQSGLPKFRIADLEGQADLMKIAQDDARLILARDSSLESARGQALRVLLYLMGRDETIRLISIG
ncbi:ATP-dependent DNA helicase RecG [Paroceanicella profunda]|uniref:Probable DNA 3'-5' helicase RecG n=1 Tax=Paroceanicella profunda TaxID=2579971 RepID=A0A5B8FHA9_9RHOB|nr:ATP-dependent DNA helicase RecG [Paroceanicella profunda]QDL92221.1 ATP-dependent DNA helicase RecG [Paroceanicella profunda]